MTIHRRMSARLSASVQFAAIALLAAAVGFFVPGTASAKNQPKPAAHASRPAARAPSRSSRPSGNERGHGPASGASHPGMHDRSNVGTTRNRDGSTTFHNSRGAEITRNREGHVASFHDTRGHEARFGSNGRVREVRGNGMTVSRGPRGMRRTVVERDGMRRVAYGHGRGYISRPYSYHGHTYYSRAYYGHGGYYRSYYHPYYYHGVYLHGYMPAYYYPPVYYGWAYNPWPSPVAYAWGWGGSPWYGYYGGYFAPYPVYPSAAYWITDYMISASLADAYAAGVAAGVSGNAARLRNPGGAHLVYASFDVGNTTTPPTMTKAVKDAISEEITRELAAAQKTQDPSDGSTASLATLLADGQPHVFVANAGLTVTSAGQDCALTEGDVLSLTTPPAQDAATANLQVLASKQSECAIGAAVDVGLDDLQEMQNHLLANIDNAMAQMKDHPGQGGLPTPPAAAIQGTTQAPYAADAPPVDPNGAAELDQQAQQGAQLEQQVVADATAPDDSTGAAAPAGNVAVQEPPPAPVRHAGPITIALGQSEADVTQNKGQPVNIVKFPTKTIYIYSDMKITFVHGKVSDVE